jgi:hypothetical protein
MLPCHLWKKENDNFVVSEESMYYMVMGVIWSFPKFSIELKARGGGIPNIRGLQWGGNTEPEPHILGMLPTFDFTLVVSVSQNTNVLTIFFCNGPFGWGLSPQTLWSLSPFFN